eukprot:2305425-Amphidinium_carterae.1
MQYVGVVSPVTLDAVTFIPLHAHTSLTMHTTLYNRVSKESNKEESTWRRSAPELDAQTPEATNN